MKKPIDIHLKVSTRFNDALERAHRQTGETKSWIIRHATQEFLLKKGYYHE